MLSSDDLPFALARIQLATVRGPWSRIVAFRHLLKFPAQPLWAAGSKMEGARFTPKGSFDSLYLSSDPVTALAEVNGLVILPGGPIPIPSPPFTLFTVNGIIHRVLDLTNPETLKTLDTTSEEMTSPWIFQDRPPTQILAQAAYNSERVAGIRYHSAKHRGQNNLVVFPDRLHPASGDFLEVHDPHGHLFQRIGTQSPN